jgi:uncharacterized protein (DUF1810 family)
MKTLARFVEAQENTYDRALSEIVSGRKQTHWMWFVFPQLEELGRTETAKFYGISGLEEARAYLRHDLLGKRLTGISTALLQLGSNDATAVMGQPDDLKLRSSMTLFSLIEGAPAVFREVLDKFYDGRPDPLTLKLLGKQLW